MKATSIEASVAALRRMTVTQLREQHLEVFGESTNATNKDFLFKRIAWRIQSLAEGGLSERARCRAEELARDADIRTTAPRSARSAIEPTTSAVTMPAPKKTAHDRLPMPGTVLTRSYRGRRIEVKVLTGGFDYDGRYGVRIGVSDAVFALEIGERVFKRFGGSVADFSQSSGLLDDDLVNISMFVYQTESRPTLKRRAMDLFEEAMRIGSYHARRALEEADR